MFENRMDPPAGMAHDHALIVATVAVRQAATPTARLAGRLGTPGGDLGPIRALVSCFAAADPAVATRALGGSFHPDVARTAPASNTRQS
jgi:hypothetical protein